MFSKQRSFQVAAVLVLLAALQPVMAAYNTGDTAANFTLPIHGTSTNVSLYDYAGQIIVLDFWAYWCGPCKTASSELEPQIQQYYQNLGGNPGHIPVKLISINIDCSNTSAADAYIATYGLETVLDDCSWVAYNAFGGEYIPQIAIVNGAAGTNHKQWEVLYNQAGYNAGMYTSFRAKIDSVTGGSADTNGDGIVNYLDLKTLANQWLQPPGNPSTDLNGNGIVNLADFVLMASKWLQVVVPNVVGLTQAAATSAITAVNLSVGTVTRQYDTTVAAGLVISQNPLGGTFVNTGSAVNLVISLGNASSNDTFANAINITGTSGRTTGSNVGATKESGEPSHAGNAGGASVWWYWTAPSSGQMTIDTFGSSFDTLLAVYTGSSVASLTSIASNDDSGGVQSKVTFSAVAGTVYRIAVDGYNGATGNITLNWSLAP